MHQYDQFVETFLKEKDSQEARNWLASMGKDYGVIHEMSHEESIDVVEAAYSRGAQLVQVVGEFGESSQEANVDMLLMTLPNVAGDRTMLFDLEEQVAAETGFEGSIDEGQRYILLRWT